MLSLALNALCVALIARFWYCYGKTKGYTEGVKDAATENRLLDERVEASYLSSTEYDWRNG